MKLLRVGPAGAERPALLDEEGVLRDLSSVVRDVDGALFGDASVLDRVRAALGARILPRLEPAGLRVGPPVARIGKIVCVGLNYHGHVAEMGVRKPAEPALFLKAPDTVVGPEDTVLIPPGSLRTDWEAELAVVLGRTARRLETDEDALAAVAGYTISNDVSERAYQLERGGQWDKGKNCETFNPLGPWLVTADEIPDPQALAIRTRVNGRLMQDSTTADQIFPVAHLVCYISQFMTLYPGDVINTGTPAGVALGRPEPRPYLRSGDLVELEIEGLGGQRVQFKGG
ncbi:fumarylacetoacetate hydrolase family protein [Streptomyces caatingaensis]|uniref:2-hydroxyhepta-2,4-diene-1,7-dioate isomerase n=1 Tax=Streptomyces caatingaensis TaxID=1678637 RepID=A0A0K9X861_9ACTN|nr:fumarylacetoacetate hydrolase family protein [Streptomyces caatingaensis]KNB49388.1 2-hydroxyhepta-2,4-diene-1,7-dioate isomerase [Streptomyces caatingaensis]